MIIAITRNIVDSAKKDDYASISNFMMKEMAACDDCLQAYTFSEPEKQDSVMNIEIWRNKDAREKYCFPIFLKYKSSLKPYFKKKKSLFLKRMSYLLSRQ